MPNVFDGVTYYSLLEAAKIIGVHHRTIHNWATGLIELPGLKIQVKYDQVNRQRFLSENTVNELKQRFSGGKLKKHKAVRKPYTKSDRTTLTHNGVTYYTLPTAAKMMHVSRKTMLNWVTGKVASLNDLKPDAIRKPGSRRYYVSERSLQKLAHDRFSTLEIDPSKKYTAPHA